MGSATDILCSPERNHPIGIRDLVIAVVASRSKSPADILRGCTLLPSLGKHSVVVDEDTERSEKKVFAKEILSYCSVSVVVARLGSAAHLMLYV